MPRFAANLSFLYQELTFLDRFAAARNAGFGAVEYLFPYDFEPSEIAARLDETGLVQALFNLPPGDWDGGERGLAALPGREDDFARAVDQAGTYAQALGCKQVHAMAGLLPDEAERARYQDTYLKNLAYAAETLKSAGIRVLIEPLNSGDMPGYFLNGSAQAKDIIAAVGSDNLALQYDIYHMQIMEGHLAASLESLMDIIAHIQIAGVPGRNEPDTGEINYPYLFSRLDELGYDGWVGCEYRPAGATEAGFGWAASFGISPGGV